MKNLLKKQSDTQIIAHSVLQKQYTQFVGLPASQNGQRRSLVLVNLLHPQEGDRRIIHLHLKQTTYNQTTKGGAYVVA